MPDGTWSLAEAEAKFGEVVERARTQGPQHLTRDGQDAAVVLSAEEYERLRAAAPPEKGAPSWLDPSFRLLTDEEHAHFVARDKDPGRIVEF